MGGLFFLLAFLQVQPTPSPRAAIDRALPILQRSATEFVSQRSCFSCHHNALPILTLNMARDRGFEINTAALARIEDKTFAPLRDPDALDKTVQAELLIDPATNDSLLLMAAASARVNRSLTTAVRASQLLAWQVDGHWATSDFRPPHSSSLFTSTANTIRAIHFFAPTELRTQADRALAKAREWLRKNEAHIHRRRCLSSDGSGLGGSAGRRHCRRKEGSAGNAIFRWRLASAGWIRVGCLFHRRIAVCSSRSWNE
jgi:N-acyl-D-amino-acid deacylase